MNVTINGAKNWVQTQCDKVWVYRSQWNDFMTHDPRCGCGMCHTLCSGAKVYILEWS